MRREFSTALEDQKLEVCDIVFADRAQMEILASNR